MHDPAFHIFIVLSAEAKKNQQLDYELDISKCEFKLSKYEFKLSKYEFKLSKYKFKLSKYYF